MGNTKIQTFLFLEVQPIVQLQLIQFHMDQQLLGELQIHLQVLIGQIWHQLVEFHRITRNSEQLNDSNPNLFQGSHTTVNLFRNDKYGC